MTADELSLDLLSTLALGLTEGRLAALLKRWSKEARKADGVLLETNLTQDGRVDTSGMAVVD